MEIPQNIKTLYNHWQFHTKNHSNNLKPKVNTKLLSEISQFITKRQLVWERKSRGESFLTYDPILQKYRFCNIYRELDRQTIEIHTLLKPMQNDFDLWLLNLAFNRFLCKPETFKAVGALSFDKVNNFKVLQKLKAHSKPKYGSAYIFPISIIQKSEYKTREEFFCLYLPKVIQDISKIIQSFERKSVVSAIGLILPEFGFNFKFHFTEILIDIAYQYPKLINLYDDFPIGPGSMSTIKSLSHGNVIETCKSLVNIDLENFPYLSLEGSKVNLSAENWEGIGCEFRKYRNLKAGHGRVRRYKFETRNAKHETV